MIRTEVGKVRSHECRGNNRSVMSFISSIAKCQPRQPRGLRPRGPRTESLLLEANLWPPIQSSLAKLPPRQAMV